MRAEDGSLRRVQRSQQEGAAAAPQTRRRLGGPGRGRLALPGRPPEGPWQGLSRRRREREEGGPGSMSRGGGKWWKGPDLGSGLKAECGLMVGTWGRRASSTPKAHGLDSTEGERKSTGGLGWRFKRPL